MFYIIAILGHLLQYERCIPHGQNDDDKYCFYCTMMLLIGICISLTKKPMKPMRAKPIAVAIAIF